MSFSRYLRCRLLVSVAVVAAMLASCGGRVPITHLGLRASPEGLSARLGAFYADRLAVATSIEAGEFRVYSLGKAFADRPDLLRPVTAEAASPWTLSLQIAGIDEAIALYVRYPGNRELSSLHLLPVSESATDGFLTFALPGKLRGLLPVALAPLGNGTIPPLRMELAFSPAQAHTEQSPLLFRGFRPMESPKVASTPFTGESSQVTDFGATVDGMTVDFAWTERNSGDYNNDGTVTILDVTPLAAHFSETVTTPEQELVDGNGDGAITILDVTPVAANFGNTTAGYDLFILSIPSLATPVTPDDFASVTPVPNPLDPGNPRPTVPRTLFYTGEPPTAPKRHIRYTFSHDFTSGTYAIAVRGYGLPGDDLSEARFSNIEKVALAPSTNHPPEWVDTVGIQDAQPLNAAVRVSFGDALDPDGDPVHFIIYYQEGSTVDPETAMAQRKDRQVPETPPYNVTVSGLTNGKLYAFMVRVYDMYGTEETPPNSSVLTARPTDTAPNALPWPYLRKDEAHTGYLPGSSLREPLIQLWARSYKATPGGGNESSPVLDETSVYIGSTDGSVYAFDQLTGDPDPAYGEDGAQVGSTIGTSTAALYDDTLVIGVAPGSYRILRRSDRVEVGHFDLDNANAVRSSPLVLGGVVYAGSEEGYVYAFSVSDGSPIWEPQAHVSSGPVSGSPATDGEYVYAASEDGYVHKLSRENGQEAAKSPDLGSISYSSPVLYPPQEPQYVLVGANYEFGEQNCFYALSALDLSKEHEFPVDRGVNGSPLVIQREGRPVAVVGETTLGVPADTGGKLYAFDLETGDELWRTENVGRIFSSPAASATRIFVGSQNGNLYVFDYNGVQRGPAIDLGAPVHTSPAIFEDRLYIANSNSVLFCFHMEADMLAPEWLDTVGAAGTDTDFGQATVHWGPAEDNYYDEVYYQLFYADNPSVNCSTPDGTLQGTVLVKDLTELSCTVDGLADGIRYYFAVRASDLPWDDDPNIDNNYEVVGATPPWNVLRTFQLGDGVLPQGPSLDYLDASWNGSELAMAYSDEKDENPGHVRYFTWNGVDEPEPPEEVFPTPPDGFLACGLELSRNFAGQELIAFPGLDHYYYAERTSPGSWSLYADPLFSVPVHPAVSVSHTGEARMMAVLHQQTPPSPGVSVMVRRGSSGAWFAEELLATDLVYPMYIRAFVAPFHTGDKPLVLFQLPTRVAGGSFIPDRGKLHLAEYDGSWSVRVLDGGGHGEQGDTGKNIAICWDEAQERLLAAYYDFWLSAGTPQGRLRLASIGASEEAPEEVAAVNMPEDECKEAHYYHDLGLAVVDGQPAIASFSRTAHPGLTDPESVSRLYYLLRQSPGAWRSELVTEKVVEYLYYSAPLKLLPEGPQGYPTLLYITGEERPDTIVIWQRGPLAG